MKTNDKSKVTKTLFSLSLASSFSSILPASIQNKKLTRTHTFFVSKCFVWRARAAVFQLLWSLFIEIFTCSISCCTDVNSLNTHCRELYEFMWNDKVKWRYKKQYCHLWYDEWVNVRLILQLATESCKILQNMNDNQMS